MSTFKNYALQGVSMSISLEITLQVRAPLASRVHPSILGRVRPLI